MTQIHGRDLVAPRRRITLEGQTYDLAFNNRSARIAEDVYIDVYGVDPAKASYMNVISEASNGRHRAIQAIYYGALIAGGCDMPWDQFDANFTYAAVEGVKEIIMQALSDALPPDDPNAAGQPQDQKDGHGAG